MSSCNRSENVVTSVDQMKYHRELRNTLLLAADEAGTIVVTVAAGTVVEAVRMRVVEVVSVTEE